MAVGIFRRILLELLDEERPFGTRADNAHFPLQDIDKLRQLIQAHRAQKAPHLRDARIVLPRHHRAARLLRILAHAAKFINLKLLAIPSGAHLFVKNRPLAVQLDGQCNGKHRQSRQSERGQGEKNI